MLRTALKHYERWHCTDTDFLGNFLSSARQYESVAEVDICYLSSYRLLVNVDFVELCILVLWGFGKLLENRRDHLARATPLRPEVEEGGFAAINLFRVGLPRPIGADIVRFSASERVS